MDIKPENIRYWNNRAASYSELNRIQLNGPRAGAWLEALEGPLQEAYPQADPSSLRVLDIGCGPGLFCILLAQRGYRVTGVDYTPNMLLQARANADGLQHAVDFHQADAQDLPFPDKSFHAVVSRNLTWNLPEPQRAYAEWKRVLAPDGIIVNFDANWYRYLCDDDARQAYERDRIRTHDAGVTEACEVDGYERMEAIARIMPLTPLQRPAWDLHVLTDMGMRAQADEGIWRQVWSEEEQLNFASTPLFRIVARV